MSGLNLKVLNSPSGSKYQTHSISSSETLLTTMRYFGIARFVSQLRTTVSPIENVFLRVLNSVAKQSDNNINVHIKNLINSVSVTTEHYQKPASKWISVDDKLPCAKEIVLVKNDKSKKFALAYIIQTSHLLDWNIIHSENIYCGVFDCPITNWKYVELD